VLEVLEICIWSHTGARWTSDGQRFNGMQHAMFLEFSGQGSTPADRVASMQRHISAFSTDFLQPNRWTSHPCLTTINMGDLNLLPATSMLRTSSPLLPVFCVPSLENLCIDLPSLPRLPSAAAEQRHLSRLSKLSAFSVVSTPSITPCVQDLWESLGALTSLQFLEISKKQYLNDNGPRVINVFPIPITWAALSRLTRLSFSDTCVSNPQALLPLTALQSLWLYCPAEQLAWVVTCCAQLASLTALTLFKSDGQPPAGQDLAGPAHPSLPCGSYSSPLQDLNLRYHSLADAPLELLPALTRLAYCSGWAPRSPPFPGSQVKPLADLKMLRSLDLSGVTLTPEFCWCVVRSMTDMELRLHL
jgi:hypothetical protein